MKSKNFKLISNFKNLIQSNFIFSALNPAFIAYYFRLIQPSKNLYLWCMVFLKIH